MNNTNGFHDPADLNEASYSSHPMEEMEPLEDKDTVWIDFKAFGNLQARIYAWKSLSRDIVGWGYRGWVEVYVMRPDLIQGQTLEMFGDETNVTRQAINKLVLEFRSLTGMRGRNMRSNETRLRCQKAHQR